MSLVGETYISGGSIAGARFVGDKAYVSAVDFNGNNGQFHTVDLSDHLTPKVVGNLAINGTLSYLQEIVLNNKTYVLGIGSETDEIWQSYTKLSLFDIKTPSSPKLTASYNGDAASSSDVTNDFLAVRYLPESARLIVPFSRYDGLQRYSDFFTAFDISKDSIIPAFNVTHSTSESFCWYEASIPARSFVVQSELITVKGHTVIGTDMQSGSLISELDLDVGLNYSVCESWFYYNYEDDNYGYNYNDVAEGTTNATETCAFPNIIYADIIDICTDTKYASRTWVFNLTSITYCTDSKFFDDSIGNVSSVDECAQKCVEKYDGLDGVNYPVTGFHYNCNGNCVCLVDIDDVQDLILNASVSSGCYVFDFPMGAAAMDPEGLDDAYGC
jgi:hypothetical protein